MAGKISEDADAGALGGGELIPVVDSGVNKTTIPARVGTLHSNGTVVGCSGTGETDLMSFTLPASMLGTLINGLQFEAWFDTVNNANAKNAKLYFGGTALQTFTFITSEVGCGRITGSIIRTGADAQQWVAQYQHGPSTAVAFANNGALTKTEASTQIFKFTGQGGATDDIKQRGLIIRPFF